jgi:hypothetical protein
MNKKRILQLASTVGLIGIIMGCSSSKNAENHPQEALGHLTGLGGLMQIEGGTEVDHNNGWYMAQVSIAGLNSRDAWYDGTNLEIVPIDVTGQSSSTLYLWDQLTQREEDALPNTVPCNKYQIRELISGMKEDLLPVYIGRTQDDDRVLISTFDENRDHALEYCTE